MKSNLLYFSDADRMAQMAEMQPEREEIHREADVEESCRAVKGLALSLLIGYALWTVLGLVAFAFRACGVHLAKPF